MCMHQGSAEKTSGETHTHARTHARTKRDSEILGAGLT